MKIKQLMATAAAAILMVTGAKADDWVNTRLCYDTGHDALFNANEASLDLFGTYQAFERHFLAWPNTSIHHGNYGGGVGGNYFFTRELGIGAEAAFLAGTGAPHFTDHVGGNLFLRLPIDVAHIAPYVFGGGGRAFNPTWNWYWDFGVGLEFRFNPKMGIFADARYIWKDEGARDQAALRAGLRLVF
ncbi:MAG TPA: outer membrane beta-barrel protein [Verrucomicrobiae bacterium]|nr:outer membrane beta-barrel protein [Verrucomicrobiae bacterium]